MKCTHPGCSYESTNPNPMVAKRNLGIHFSHAHGLSARRRARKPRQERADAAIAVVATQSLREDYRSALGGAAAAGAALGRSARNAGEVTAGLVLFLAGLHEEHQWEALESLGWKDGNAVSTRKGVRP